MRTCGCEGEGGICNDCLMKSIRKSLDAQYPDEVERVIEVARELVLVAGDPTADRIEVVASIARMDNALQELDKFMEDNNGLDTG